MSREDARPAYVRAIATTERIPRERIFSLRGLGVSVDPQWMLVITRSMVTSSTVHVFVPYPTRTAW